MALAYIEGERIWLQSEWRERELIKEVPGHKYSEERRAWSFPLSWATCVALRGVLEDRLQIDTSLNEWAAREVETRVGPCLRLRQSRERIDSVYEAERLEDLQTVCVEFLCTAERGLCGDGMGSGKTVEAICTVEELARRHGDDAVFPCLIVCTNTMVWKWDEELTEWARNGRTIGVLKGSKAQRDKIVESRPDYLVINWEGLASHSRLAGYGSISLTDKEKELKNLNEIGVKTVVADEAHRAKNPKAKQTRAWWWMSWTSDYSIALTGTPINRTPEDMWSIMHGVAPHEWPSKTAWVDRYGLKSWGAFGGLVVNGLRGDTQDELFKYLDPRFIRRPTNVVIPNIAQKLEPQVRKIELTGKQKTAYNQLRKEMIALLDEGFVMATDTLAKMTRLRQLASAYLEVNEDGSVRMTTPSNKVTAALDLIDELDEDPVVFFAQDRQLIDLVAKKLESEEIPFGTIVGGQNPLDRIENVNRFQAGEFKAMLATLGAGGEGVTLTRSPHVCFLQRDPSRIKNEQATDRVWRRGQDRDVQPIYIVTGGTIDERMLKIGEKRDATFEELVRDEETIRNMLEI